MVGRLAGGFEVPTGRTGTLAGRSDPPPDTERFSTLELLGWYSILFAILARPAVDFYSRVFTTTLRLYDVSNLVVHIGKMRR